MQHIYALSVLLPHTDDAAATDAVASWARVDPADVRNEPAGERAAGDAPAGTWRGTASASRPASIFVGPGDGARPYRPGLDDPVIHHPHWSLQRLEREPRFAAHRLRQIATLAVFHTRSDPVIERLSSAERSE